MTVQTSPAIRAWNEPDGLSARGTLIVLGGRGETPEVYERFATRVSRDAYRVRALGDGGDDAADVRRAVEDLLADETLPGPRVLVGSDTGAVLALEIAATSAVDAVVLAGLPAGPPGDVSDEISARTACPNHQGVLRRAEADGVPASLLPPELLSVAASAVTVPILGLHGEADAISAVDDALAILRRAPRAEIHTVAGGRHDILNDVTHRSVAATIVLFLERLRASPEATAIVRAR